MSEHTRKYFTCDICGVEMVKPYCGGESGTYEMIATEDYAVAGGYAIKWRDLCQPCNNFLEGAISDLKRRGDEIRKARQGAIQ